MLEGVPGLAKTLMVSALARSLQLKFSRVQFTPDLMPSDITGTEVIQEDRSTGERKFRFISGPIFSNLILADEINRTPQDTSCLARGNARTPSDHRRCASCVAQSGSLCSPHKTLSSKKELTLPKAQQDRFMLKVFVKYPSYDEEFQIAASTTSSATAEITGLLSGEEILSAQQLVRRVPVPPFAIHYALRLVRATRVHEADAPEFVKDLVNWGSGPRGLQYLLLGPRLRAVLQGRFAVTGDDIRAVAHPVLAANG
ncbi:MAG: MoxR family ATPase [Pirellulales bacterium]